MLSNKWTFSLTYLVMLIAIGFAMGLIVTPGVIAHEDRRKVVLADGAKTWQRLTLTIRSQRFRYQRLTM